MPESVSNSDGNPRKAALDRLRAGEERNIAELPPYRRTDTAMFDRPVEVAPYAHIWLPFDGASPPVENDYYRALVPYLVQEVACQDEHAARGIARRAFDYYSPQARLQPLLAAALLAARGSGDCPGIAALSAKTVKDLEEKAAAAATAPPAGQ